jgi:hypothetical protein
MKMRDRLGITPTDPNSASTKIPFSFGFVVKSDEAPLQTGADVDDLVGSTGLSATLRNSSDTAHPVHVCVVQQQISEANEKPRRRAEGPGQIDDKGYVERRAYIGGMPFWYSEEQIYEVWESCGAIEELTMLTFPDTGNFRGIAFVTFKTQEGFKAALAYHGDELDGKTLVVKPCQAPMKWSTRTEQQKSFGEHSTKRRSETQEAAAAFTSSSGVPATLQLLDLLCNHCAFVASLALYT